MSTRGLIHVYYGSGKGKTTAALGLAFRASGYDMKTVIVQFLKNSPCGEVVSAERSENIEILRGKAGKAFAFTMSQEEKKETRAIHDLNLQKAKKLVESGECDLLILDEALDAYELGLLDEAAFRSMVMDKPEGLELVITGHRPIDWVLKRADYITEMVKHRHPYDAGIRARKGIEF